MIYSTKNIILRVLQLFFRVDVLVASFMISIFSLALPLSILVIYDRIIPNQSLSSLYIIVAGVVVVVLFEVILRHLRSHILGWYAARYRYQILGHFFKKSLHKQIYSKPTAYAQNLVEMESMEKQKDLVAQNMITVIFDIPFVLVMLLFLFLIGQWVVIVPMILLALSFLMVQYYGKKLRNLDHHSKNNRKSRFGYYYTALHHITAHKAQAKEKRMIGKIDGTIIEQSKVFYKQQMLQASFQNLSQFLAQSGLVTIVAVGSVLVIQETLSLGSLAAITLMTGRLMQPLMRMMQTLLQLWRLDKIIIPKKRLELSKGFKLKNIAGEAQPLLKKSMRLQDVHFAYDKSTPILKGLDLEIEIGDIISIQGDSAAGKSTLLKLIQNELVINSGKFWIDHVVIEQDERPFLADKIAYVHPYESFLPGTIRDNLCNFDHDVSFDKIDHLIKVCELDKEIGGLPEGLMTQVGHQLSDSALPSSILTKLFIIRAAIHDPKLLLVDDIAVGVDGKTIQDLSRLFKVLSKKMAIIITSQLQFFGPISTQKLRLEDGKLEKIATIEQENKKAPEARLKKLRAGQVETRIKSPTNTDNTTYDIRPDYV